VQIDHFAGTHLAGALRISEDALNELLNIEQSPFRGATIAVDSENVLVLRYGLIRARFALVPVIEVGDSPRVRLLLASMLISLAMRTAMEQPYITVKGREVTVSLAEVPALQHLHEVWAHVRSAGLRTDGHALVVDFTFSITE
jgi:hypothetical protein